MFGEIPAIIFCGIGAIVSLSFLVGTIIEMIGTPYERNWFNMGMSVFFLCLTYLFCLAVNRGLT